MKLIVTLFAFCYLMQLQAQQSNERFYKGESGKKIRQQGQNLGLETCADNSQTTLSINSNEEEESESMKFIGSCPDGHTLQLTDKGVLKFRVSPYGDTLIASKFKDNGRLSFQKTTVRRSISRFQQKLISFQNGGYIASYITYPPAGKTHAVVGYIIYDAKGNEITQRTVDSLVDPSPTALLLDGATETDFYILQGTDTQCGTYKLHKLSRATKVWTTTLNYNLGCHQIQLESFAINRQNTRLGLLFVGTSRLTNFNIYFMVNNTTGVLIPTTFDIATRVRYNAKTTFGPNNEVYFARVIDYNTVNSPVPNRSALEVLQFDANQNRKSQKRYFDSPKRETDTLPKVEDMLVATNGTLYVAGARLKKTWLLSYKDTASGVSNVPQQNMSTTIRQVSRVPNSPNIAIEIESPSNKTVTLEIFNTLNQVVRTQQPNLQQGINTIQIGFSNQPNGTYIAKLTTAGNSSTFTFVKM